jgi:hypothetical protein
MSVQASGSPVRLSMETMIRSENDIRDMCMMESKAVRSLAALSMARMVDSEHVAEDISIRDSCG